jgi:two-component system OmpR family response regulator/two-component system copper resistance phosphate regulon response regulator CusR
LWAGNKTAFCRKDNMNILIIEDDPVIGKSLVKGFTEAGHTPEWVQNGEQGLESALSQQADAIVLDLMLPKRSGQEVLQELRRRGVLCPVILLTALGAVDDRVEGLNSGADDYIVKPFDFAELLARVQAVVRRSSVRPAPVLSAGGLTLDLTTRRVSLNGVEVELTPIEFSLLELLMRYSGQVVTRKMLCEHVWGFNWDGTTNVIEVHINRLRGKIDKGREQSYITTVRGRGYALAAT